MIRQAISFVTGITGAVAPRADNISLIKGAATEPVITDARRWTRGSFLRSVGSCRIANGESDLRIPERCTGDLHFEFAVQIARPVSRNDSTDCTVWSLRTGAFSRMSPCSVAFGKPHEDEPFCTAFFEPCAGMFENGAVVYPGQHNCCGIDIAAPQSRSRIASEASGVGSCIQRFRRAGSAAKTVNEHSARPFSIRRSAICVVPALAAGVPDMERRFCCTKQLDEIRKLRVATGVAAAADGDRGRGHRIWSGGQQGFRLRWSGDPRTRYIPPGLPWCNSRSLF